MKKNKIILSILPFLIIFLSPLSRFISLPAKYSKFQSLPLLLSFLVSFSLFILLITLFSKIKIDLKINDYGIYILIIIYALIFSSLAILKHLSFHSTALDLGIYDQSMWGYSNGKNVINTIVGLKLLSYHVQPILFIITPLYWLFKTPITLLILQAVVIALGALPLYWLARKQSESNLSSLLIAVAYLLYPTLQYINLFDFHPESFAIAFFMFSFYFLYVDKFKLYLVFAVLGSFCKEYFCLIFFMMGLYSILKKRKWAIGVLSIVLSLFLLHLNFNIILPSFSGGSYHYLGKTAYLGKGFGEIITTVLTRPLYVTGHIAWSEKIIFFALLFLPAGLGLLSIFSLDTLLIALPTISMLTLLKLSGISEILYHRPAELIPFIFLSAVLGISTISKMRLLKKDAISRFINKDNLFIALSLFVFTTSFLSNLFYGPFAILYGKSTFDITPTYVKEGHEIIKLIPSDASVATFNWIVPHLTQRKEIYRIQGTNLKKIYDPLPKEFKDKKPEYILLDLSKAFQDLSRSGGGINSSQIGFVFNDDEYGVIVRRGVWVLLKRGENYEKGICKVKEFFDKKQYPYLDISIENKGLLEKC